MKAIHNIYKTEPRYNGRFGFFRFHALSTYDENGVIDLMESSEIVLQKVRSAIK